MIVYDGKGDVRIPPTMGEPTTEQLVGTPLENLGEVSSRICYDSLGYDESGKPRGRSSSKLHEHILQVKNHSVYEHCNFTLRFETMSHLGLLRSLINRKGVWVRFNDDSSLSVTINLRAILEWDRHDRDINRGITNTLLKQTFTYYGHQLAPQIIRDYGQARYENSSLIEDGLDDDQQWVSMYLSGSRSWSHEQVRHRFAMSQRSTRYVDEDGSEYVMHPLVKQYLNNDSVKDVERALTEGLIRDSIQADRETYRYLVEHLQTYLLNKGVDKLTARKQARAASRQYLGNGLRTEMIFSAPISGWKWILSQRAAAAADQEIRETYTNNVLTALKDSRFGNRFEDFKLIDSPDGIGEVLKPLTLWIF